MLFIIMYVPLVAFEVMFDGNLLPFAYYFVNAYSMSGSLDSY